MPDTDQPQQPPLAQTEADNYARALAGAVPPADQPPTDDEEPTEVDE